MHACHLFACLFESVGVCSASVYVCMLCVSVNACYASVYPYVPACASI